MKYREAISLADKARPNTVTDDVKFSMLHELETSVAELMQVPVPLNPFPSDGDLLMGAPHDNIYKLYLMAMCDFEMQDAELYEADYAMFSNKYKNAAAAWRRSHATRVNEMGARV